MRIPSIYAWIMQDDRGLLPVTRETETRWDGWWEPHRAEPLVILSNAEAVFA